MKVIVKNVSQLDAYYDNREKIIGREFEVLPESIKDWGEENWYGFMTTDPMYGCFHMAQIEVTEE